MRFFIRSVVAFLSAGWLAPLSLAFYLVWDYEWRVISPMVFLHSAKGVNPFHGIKYAWLLCEIGGAWLTLVVVGWSFYLTRPRDQ